MSNFPTSPGNSITLERPARRNDALTHYPPNKQMLVLIDKSLPDVMMLVAGVQPGAEVILLDPEQDGIEQITQLLNQYSNLNSLHLVAHGSPGSFMLGSANLNLETIKPYAAQIQTWSNCLSGSSLMIYGCQVASGQVGKHFLQRLGQLTEANIAASSNKVGSEQAGGRWQLNYHIGQITSNLAFVPSVQENYPGVFANYNESVDGDISDNRSAPDSLQLEEGVNSLTATSSGGDLEYITVNVPEGFQLDSLVLADYVSEDAVAFAGIQSGTTFTEPPSGTAVGNLLGWTHMGASQQDSDILDDIGEGPGAIGFTAPLVSGNYTFWLQQLGEPTTYTLEFNVSPVANASPVVSFSATPTLLKESDATAITLTFNLDKAPPAGGVKVYLDSNTLDALGEFDLDTLAFTGGTAPEPNENASGFYFNITEQTATITLKVLADGETEGTESLTFTLQTGDGYTVDPNTNSTTLTINDEDTISMPVVSFEAIPANVSEETPDAQVIWKWTVTGDFPDEGIVVNFDTLGENDVIKFTEQFAGNREVEFINSEIVGFDEATGRLQILLTTPNDSSFVLPIANDVIEEGEQTFDFQLAEGEGYTVDPLKNSTLLTITDDNGGPGVGPTVGISVDKTELTEKGDEITVTFTVDGEIPEGGVTVLVSSPSPLSVADFDVAGIDPTDITGTNGEPLEGNASSFLITITEPTATITVSTFDDDIDEGGIEEVTFNIVNGEDYEVDPDASDFTVNIDDELDPNRPTVSFNTIEGAYDPGDNILAPELVRSLEEGASLLTFVFQVDGEIPEGGLIVDVNSTINLTDYFTGLARPPFSPGGQVLEAIYDPEDPERPTGFRFRIDQPNALFSFRLINDEEASGIEEATFTLEPRESYAIDPEAGSSTVTIYDTLENVPEPTVVPEVNFSVSTTSLVESEGTVLIIDFTVDGEIPEGGVLVSVAALEQFLGDFDIFATEVEGGVFPAPNFLSTGFFFKIYESEASITIPIFPDGETEGLESVTLSLQEAPGYTISPDAEAITLTLTDTAESEIQVSLSGTPAVLVEEDGTVSVHTFTLSTAPPAGGITVSVSAPNISEFDLAGAVIEGGTISVTEDGFDLTITTQTATIELPVANDGVAEGLETATFTLVDGTGYQISSTANSSNFTIVDTAAEVPPTVSEPNDIISLAVDTKLSELNSSISFTSRIDYDNTNRYPNPSGGEGFLYIDASEDVDLYKVELKTGDTIKIDVDANQFGEGRKVDTSLRVFDANGVQVGFNEDGAAPDELFDAKWASYLEFTAPTDGAYYIGIAIYDNTTYDPFTPGSGTGSYPAAPAINEYGPGEYTLNISLNDPDAFIAEPTEIPPSTGEGPAISLFTVAGTYGNDFDNLGFDIIAPGIAETLPEDAGAALNLVLVADSEIPEGGVVVYIEGDNPILDYFGNRDEFGSLLSDKPFTRGGQFLDAIYGENGVATGFTFLLEQPFATIVLPPKTQEAPESDGPETYTFSVVESAGYTVSDQGSSTVTFYDTVEDVPLPATPPEVSLEISPTEVIESEETEFTITLSLSEPPPPEGVQVYVSGNAFDFLNELAVFDAQFTGGVPIADGAVSGFYFLMFAQTATITIPVFNSADIIEGIEEFNVEVRPGAGYTVNPDASSGLLTIKDTPESVIQVSLSSETETLIESEGTIAKLNFSLSAAPPEEGVTVTVSNPDLLEFDLATATLEGAELVSVSDDNTSFTLKITEQNASISAAVYGDDEAEASETVTFTVEAEDGYQVNPEGNEVSFTIYDSPDTAPTSTEEVNDTIGQAIATGVSYPTNPSVTLNGEISQYFVEDDEGNELTVDDSEDIDFYSFTLVAGQTVKIDVDSIPYELEGFSTQRLDSELRLFNEAGEQLAFNADGFAPDELFVAARDPYLEFTATESGTYYVGVAQWQNRVYDPLTAENSSGRVDANAGRNTGAYEITLEVGPKQEDPIVSFYTIEGAFDPEDNILAAELVRSLEDGSSLLTFVFTVDGEIPEGGLVVDVTSDINLTDYFTGLARPPFGIGGQIIEGIYDPETGLGTGFRFRIDEPIAQVSLRLINDDEATGIVDATFTLEDGEDYDVNPEADSSAVTFYDTLENVPEPTVVPEVNFSVSTTDLVESEGTVLIIDFTVDGEIPEGGLLVSVAAPQQFLGDFDIFATEVEGGVFPAPNFLSTGFFFKIFEQEASITIPIFPDGESEGIENVTLSLQLAPGYTISPDAEAITLTLSDTPESEIQVSLTTTPTLLIESEGTVAVQTFTLSTAPPEGGITVTVNVPNFKEFDLDAITVEGGTIAQLRENGYELTITAQTAIVNLPVDDDGLLGGVQPITFTLVDGEGYQVSPTANTSSVTIVDTPGDVPPPTTISEPNDIISLAVDTKLGELYPTASFSSSISYDNTNRYAVEGGFLYVDATEDVDLYKVELQAGDVLRLDIDALQIGSTLNSVLRIFDAAGTQLAQNDNGSAPGEAFLYRNDSYLEFTATTAGTYYVGVSSNPNGEFPAIANEDPYDPNEPASGTGRSTGTYTLNLSLNQEFVQAPTLPLPPPNGTGPVISLETVAGVFDDNDNILASAPVRSLEDGASLVNLILSTDDPIPAGGVEVYISSDILLSDYFNIANFPFTPGAQVVGAFYNEEGQASGLVVNLLAPNAVISLRLFNNAAATGIETATFTLEDAAGYVVDPENSTDTVTFYDTLANVPPATVTPEVSFDVTTTSLVESEGTETTLSFSLSEAPPEGGVLVYVAAPQQFIGDFDVLNADVIGGVFPAPNFSSSGFFFRIYEQQASITISAFPDGDTEGIESYTLSLQPAPGYTIDPDAEPITITITDTAESLIQVSLSRSPATLIEAAGTVAVQTFTLSAPPPEGGVTVSVSAPNLSEFDVDALAVTGGTIGEIRDDGFDLIITERTATVSLPIDSDAVVEGQETASFSLVAGTGYQIGATGTSVSFNVLDVAAVTETEVNDTIAQAQNTNLSETNTSFTINGAISVGPNSRPSQIDASEDIDLYKVDLKAGDFLKIDIDSTTYTIAASTVPQRLDSELRVFNAAGEQLAFNADGFAPNELFVAGRDPYLEFTAETAGTYYVGVAQWQNRVYDPLTAENSSGRIDVNAGRNTGAYTLNINLETPPDPIVSLAATPEVVEEGEFVTFDFSVELPPGQEFPAEGIIIGTSEFFNSQFDFNFDFEDPEYLSGIEYYDYIESPTGEVTVLWKLTSADAFIKVKAFDDTVAEEDYTFTLDLKPGEGYVVGSDTASVVISDGVPNLDDPVISLSIEPTDLFEGDTLTVTLNVVDGVIPEGGLEVNVTSDVFGSLGEFAIFDEEGNFLPIYEGFAAQPEQNAEANGFIATITEETATITLDVFDDGPNEGVEEITFSLLDGEIYGVDPDASEVTITIDDGDEGVLTGTPGNDVFDAGVSPEGFNGSNDLVFAGAGNDLLDTSNGLGNNRLYGQSGNDTFYLGSNDRAFGGAGDDVFYQLGSNSTVSGGIGSDQFWLASGEYPESANTITDFESGVDVLGIGGLGLSFAELDFSDGNNTLISAEGKEIAKLLGVNSNQLSADDFTFT